jgi:hypothetical protein
MQTLGDFSSKSQVKQPSDTTQTLSLHMQTAEVGKEK